MCVVIHVMCVPKATFYFRLQWLSALVVTHPGAHGVWSLRWGHHSISEREASWQG